MVVAKIMAPTHHTFARVVVPFHATSYLLGTIIRGTLKAPNSQLVTPISTKLQRPDGCD
jgi:hypothetical protein